MTGQLRLPALPGFDPGTVWLAGAGPGDPGLLTLLAAKALAEADVVVHDALIGAGILDLARPEVDLVDMGKRGRCRSASQDAINAELIAQARAGRRVLRLKGGDPFVFGRGGEEALALAGACIPFRIVPGVTAGIGGLAYAGIPLTHRGLATTATLVTGHDRSGGLPAGMDWQALARLPGALVFYMALGTMPAIAEKLVAAGKPAMTPVAIVSAATTAAQTTVETNLARCARDIVRLQSRRPAIIAVGEVVRVAGWLAAWQQNTPRDAAPSLALPA